MVAADERAEVAAEDLREEITLPQPSDPHSVMAARGVSMQINRPKHIALLTSSDLGLMLQIGNASPPVWARTFTLEGAECLIKVCMWTKGHPLVLPTPLGEARLPYRMTFLVPRKQGSTPWEVLQRCTRWEQERSHTVPKESFACISDPVGRLQQVVLVASNRWMYFDSAGDLRRSAEAWRNKQPEHPRPWEADYDGNSHAQGTFVTDQKAKEDGSPVLLPFSGAAMGAREAEDNPHIAYDAELGFDDEQEKHAVQEWQDRCVRARSSAGEEAKADAGDADFNMTHGMRADPELMKLREQTDPEGY